MEHGGRDVLESTVAVIGGKREVNGIARKGSIKVAGAPALTFAQLRAAPELFNYRITGLDRPCGW